MNEEDFEKDFEELRQMLLTLKRLKAPDARRWYSFLIRAQLKKLMKP